MPSTHTEPLLWIPLQGPELHRITDLQKYFPKPNVPLGEAWFMGETRELYDDLNRFGVEGTPDNHLSQYLDELISGMACFPLMGDWSQWYGYLFPRLIEKEDFFADLANGLIVLALTSQQQPAIEFELDFAAVLTRWIMQPRFWKDGIYNPPHEEGYRGICSTPWGEPSVYPDLSTSLFLCWRYLPADAIRPWLHSAMAIEDVHWRIQLMAWMLNVHPLVASGVVNLAALTDFQMEKMWNQFYLWGNSASIYPERHGWEMITVANVNALQLAIRTEFTEAVYFAWIDQFVGQTKLWPQLELLIEQFQTAYLTAE